MGLIEESEMRGGEVEQKRSYGVPALKEVPGNIETDPGQLQDAAAWSHRIAGNSQCPLRAHVFAYNSQAADSDNIPGTPIMRCALPRILFAAKSMPNTA